MDSTAEDPSRRQEIRSSLKSIVETSDKWLERIRKREARVRVASSFLTTILVWVAVGGFFLGIFVIQLGGFGGLAHFFQQPVLDDLVAGSYISCRTYRWFCDILLTKEETWDANEGDILTHDRNEEGRGR